MRDVSDIEQMLGVNLMPWQREVMERMLRGERTHLQRGRTGGLSTVTRAARLARVCDAIDDLERGFGITGHVGTDARCIVVSESDYAVMVSWAERELVRDPFQREDSFASIPIVTAPDWACDEFAIAWLRLRAHIARPFRRLLRWLVRR